MGVARTFPVYEFLVLPILWSLFHTSVLLCVCRCVELTQENGKLHLQLKDAEFEVEMLKEDAVKMVAVMEQSHEIQREATQALVQAEARAVKAQGRLMTTPPSAVWLVADFLLFV